MALPDAFCFKFRHCQIGNIRLRWRMRYRCRSRRGIWSLYPHRILMRIFLWKSNRKLLLSHCFKREKCDIPYAKHSSLGFIVLQTESYLIFSFVNFKLSIAIIAFYYFLFGSIAFYVSIKGPFVPGHIYFENFGLAVPSNKFIPVQVTTSYNTIANNRFPANYKLPEL